MARHIEDEVEYYYDSHATEKDRMGQPSNHADLVRYLWDALKRLFHEQTCAIYKNLNFYQTSDPFEYPEEPDLAIIKGIVYQKTARHYHVGKSGLAPHMIFEIASDETWNIDLEEKPVRYARMGVQEYFAYDPYEPLLPESGNQRLFGWQLDPSGSHMKEMQLRSDGSLWSPNLDSWLVPDGTLLRLYDRSGHMRLTHGESADLQAERERQQAEIARQQAEAEARRSQTYAEKLRSLGIDPEQLI